MKWRSRLEFHMARHTQPTSNYVWQKTSLLRLLLASLSPPHSLYPAAPNNHSYLFPAIPRLSLSWIKISHHLISELVTLINFLANASQAKVLLQVLPTAENSKRRKCWQFLKHTKRLISKAIALIDIFLFSFPIPRKNAPGCQITNIPKCLAQTTITIR